ncbi:ABC transporter ATP-binding protein [Candidatus Woesebacteria bacterium]|nr:ABC transporter ATP-binding protein [Candidatus Woesebacteria bacterium]
MASNKTLISVDQVSKSFDVGTQNVDVLKDITFTITEGDFVLIFGPSGCGKSTLLHVLLGLEKPNTGTVQFNGTKLYDLPSDDDRADFRKNNIGMVYQQANWVKSLSVQENVELPLLLLGYRQGEARSKALSLLQFVGMSDWAEFVPTELSGGQQQRVALARALIHEPLAIIADEPTGNLDFQAGVTLMKQLQKLNQEQGKTVIMVTHDLMYLKYAKSIIQIADGQLDKIVGAEGVKKIIKQIQAQATSAQ